MSHLSCILSETSHGTHGRTGEHYVKSERSRDDLSGGVGEGTGSRDCDVSARKGDFLTTANGRIHMKRELSVV